MREYYFLASLFPSLEIGHIPTLGFAELQEFLSTNLHPNDFEQVTLVRRQIDMENLLCVWLEQPLDPHGLLTKEQWLYALETQQWDEEHPFPLYFSDFLREHPTTERRIKAFSLLMSAFLSDNGDHRGEFLTEYFVFQKQFRLVLIGFRAKQLGKDLRAELQFEEGSDPLVAEILAQKDAKEFVPPFEFKELQTIFAMSPTEPLAFHKALLRYQFNTIVERWGGDLFSIDRILNYMLRLILVERWLHLDLQGGMVWMDEIERTVK